MSSRLSSKCVVASLCCNQSQKNQILFPKHKKQLRRMFLVFFCVVSVGAGALRPFVVSTAVFWLRVVKKSWPIFVETWLFRLRYGRRFYPFWKSCGTVGLPSQMTFRAASCSTTAHCSVPESATWGSCLMSHSQAFIDSACRPAPSSPCRATPDTFEWPHP